jgi:hypothetical protein
LLLEQSERLGAVFGERHAIATREQISQQIADGFVVVGQENARAVIADVAIR